MKTIVTIPCKTIRAMARQMMKGKFWMCVLVALACHLIAAAPGLIASSFIKNEYVLLLVELASFVLEVSLTLCSTRYFLMTFRGQDTDMDSFTEPMKLTWNGVIMEVISMLQIFLWSLLFVIPGIICAIKHVQNFNVMIDDPEFYPMECIRRSHEIMEGNKWKYVKLTLSFIGWEFLASLPVNLYTGYYGPKIDIMYISSNLTYEQATEMLRKFYLEMAEFSETPIAFILGLIPILVIAYRSVANAAFYDLASGNLVIQEDASSITY